MDLIDFVACWLVVCAERGEELLLVMWVRVVGVGFLVLARSESRAWSWESTGNLYPVFNSKDLAVSLAEEFWELGRSWLFD